MGSTYKALIDRARPGAMENGQFGEKKGEDWKEERVLPHERLSDRELIELWKKMKFRCDLFMFCAGSAGTIGCFVITGEDRHRVFNGW